MLLRHAVPTSEAGFSVLHILRWRFSLSHTQIRRMKRDHVILLNGNPCPVTVRVQPGDIVEVTVTEHLDRDFPRPSQITARILFEDPALLAVDKDPGILVHLSGPSREDTYQDAIRCLLHTRGDPFIPRLVGRLDRETSGVLLFAKNAHIHALMIQTMAKEDASKRYFGLVNGYPFDPVGVMDFPISRAEHSIILRTVCQDGKPCHTRYKLIRNFGTVSLLEFRLKSGRTHQIRLHCREMGFPILGDGLYGPDEGENLYIPRLALHCRELSFPHPLTKECISIRSPLPEDFRTALIHLSVQV